MVFVSFCPEPKNVQIIGLSENLVFSAKSNGKHMNTECEIDGCEGPRNNRLSDTQDANLNYRKMKCRIKAVHWKVRLWFIDLHDRESTPSETWANAHKICLVLQVLLSIIDTLCQIIMELVYSSTTEACGRQ